MHFTTLNTGHMKRSWSYVLYPWSMYSQWDSFGFMLNRLTISCFQPYWYAWSTQLSTWTLSRGGNTLWPLTVRHKFSFVINTHGSTLSSTPLTSFQDNGLANWLHSLLTGEKRSWPQMFKTICNVCTVYLEEMMYNVWWKWSFTSFTLHQKTVT